MEEIVKIWNKIYIIINTKEHSNKWEKIREGGQYFIRKEKTNLMVVD